ncbi:MAG: hydrogenase nickel incorporation protein HypA [Elusimicrobiales bacterium]|nr:hydrogenase nickel incorporation protein HypA [Elusimicrobiales bacterium]
MHEWALVDAVASAAETAAEQEKLKKVDAVVVVLGELQNVDRAAARRLFAELRKTKKKALHRARLEIRAEKAVFRCRACGKTFGLRDLNKLSHKESEAVHFLPEMAHVYTECPACASRDFEIARGRGIYVREIRGER